MCNIYAKLKERSFNIDLIERPFVLKINSAKPPNNIKYVDGSGTGDTCTVVAAKKVS